MFLLATIINIPMFVLYNAGGGVNNQTGLKHYLTALSLAYMGESSTICNFNKLAQPTSNKTVIFNL